MIRWKIGFNLILLLVISSVVNAKDFDVTKFGALGDGTTLNTEAIQKAMDECHKSGGGKVIIPAGKFLSGTVVLKDNVTLYLQKDAVLLGSTDLKDYRNLDPFTEGLAIDSVPILRPA